MHWPASFAKNREVTAAVVPEILTYLRR
jgi:hypothetical protein